MKQKLKILFVAIITLFLITGCGTVITDENGVDKQVLGMFTEIEHCEYKDCFGDPHRQYLVYDNNTKVIYIYDTRSYSTTISPYYCINEQGEPVIGVYNK